LLTPPIGAVVVALPLLPDAVVPEVVDVPEEADVPELVEPVALVVGNWTPPLVGEIFMKVSQTGVCRRPRGDRDAELSIAPFRNFSTTQHILLRIRAFAYT
jgi:hypothetical protein